MNQSLRSYVSLAAFGRVTKHEVLNGVLAVLAGRARLLLAALALFTLNASAATYYIDFSSGADSNNGTSKSTPFKRHPFMKGFSGRYTHAAGDRFIFKGGVVWPVTCFQMKISVGGASDSVRDYYGVDQSWYSGSTFSRPIFDFQSVLIGGWDAGAGLYITGSNLTFENLELANHRSQEGWGNVTVSLYGSASNVLFTYCLIRDWDLVRPISYGNAGGGIGFHGGGNGHNIVVDHCTFHQMNSSTINGVAVHHIPVMRFSEVYRTANGYVGGGTIHDNHIHDLLPGTDPLMHQTAIKTFAVSRIYNNVIYNLDGRVAPIELSPGYASQSGDEIVYNNVVYNCGVQTPVWIKCDKDTYPNIGVKLFNNTLEHGNAYCFTVGVGGAGINLGRLEVRNNLFITGGPPMGYGNPSEGWANITTPPIISNNIQLTPAQAAAAGYTPGNAFQPVSGLVATVNAGVDLGPPFNVDRLGRARSYPWDVGAYEYAGGGPVVVPPSQPVGQPGALALDSASYAVNEAAGSVTINVRRTGGSAGSVSCTYSLANGTASHGVNFDGTGGTLLWGNGDTTERRLSVTILNKSTVGNKTFSITLSGAGGGATLNSPSSATITIVGSGSPTPPPGTPTVPGSADQLLTNPGFESGWADWTATGNQGIASNAPYQPSEGGKLVVFNWGQKEPNAILSRTITSIPGQVYSLAFDVGVLAYNKAEQKLLVKVDGAGNLLAQTISLLGDGSGTTRWHPQSFQFTANSGTTTLTFQDVSTTSSDLDLLLDHVRLAAQNAGLTTSQPQSQTANPGGSVTFSVEATGSGTLSYQWRFNGNHISGANGSSYTIGNVQPSHAGQYDVIVSNGLGSVISSQATLTVVEAVTFVNGGFESGLTGWTQSGFLSAAASQLYRPSEGSKLVVFNWGQTTPNGKLEQTFSTIPGRTYVLSFDLGVLAFRNNEQRLNVSVTGNGQLLSQTLSILGQPNGSTKWEPRSLTFVADSATATLLFHDVSASTLDTDLLLDNVRVTSQGGSTTPPPPPPPTTPDPAITIVTQPANLTVNQGATATFAVEASGLGSLSYQWRFNTSPIAGATASSITIPNAQSINAGNYDVVITSGAQTITSSPGTLTVAQVQLQPFTNGSFESGFKGWSQSGHQIVIAHPFYKAIDGSALVGFNVGDMPPNAILSQSFSTTPGQVYRLSFNLGVLAYNNDEQRMQIIVSGAGTPLLQTISLNGPGGGNTRWSAQSFTFTADSSTTTLTFKDVSLVTRSLDMLLDNVQITQ